MAGTMNCSWILETDSTGRCSTQENNRQLQKFTVVASHLAFLQLIYCKLCDTIFPWSNNAYFAADALRFITRFSLSVTFWSTPAIVSLRPFSRCASRNKRSSSILLGTLHQGEQYQINHLGDLETSADFLDFYLNYG